MSNYRIIVLTEREYDDLGCIIRNGWGDGDYSRYGNANPRTQLSAMRHFDAAGTFDLESAKMARREQQVIVSRKYRKP